MDGMAPNTTIVRCPHPSGQVNVIANSPICQEHFGAIYDPATPNLFDRFGRLIMESAYFRRGETALVEGRLYYDGNMELQDAPSAEYIYIGPLREHYGHFLLSTFSRLWRRPTKSSVILTHGDVPDILARNPYMAELFGFLGILPQQIVSFSNPVRIGRVIVPAASFEEDGAAFHAFRQLCLTAARPIKSKASKQILYVTKLGLSSGISRFTNEKAIVDVMRKHDVRIFDPASVSVTDQIRTYSDHPVIMGVAGSHFHTLIFTKPKALIALGYAQTASANQILIDKVSGHKAVYLYDQGAVYEGGHSGFDANFALNDAEAVAHKMIEAGNAMMAEPQKHLPDWILNYAQNPNWKNLSQGMQCEQSSYHPGSATRDTMLEAVGAVSGFLTSGAQFSTDFETDPWWMIDLGRRQTVRQILIYNRLESARWRFSRFKIETSLNGSEWHLLFVTPDEIDVGGMYGTPFSLLPTAPVRARHIRITQLRQDYFHLDQVVVLG